MELWGSTKPTNDLSDIQAAVKALGTNSVKECLSNLNALSNHKQVVMGWVPVHKGVPGHEAANELTRERHTFLGPEPAVGISSSQVKGEVHKRLYKRHCDYWNQIEGQGHGKLTHKKPSSG